MNICLLSRYCVDMYLFYRYCMEIYLQSSYCVDICPNSFPRSVHRHALIYQQPFRQNKLPPVAIPRNIWPAAAALQLMFVHLKGNEAILILTVCLITSTS